MWKTAFQTTKPGRVSSTKVSRISPWSCSVKLSLVSYLPGPVTKVAVIWYDTFRGHLLKGNWRTVATLLHYFLYARGGRHIHRFTPSPSSQLCKARCFLSPRLVQELTWGISVSQGQIWMQVCSTLCFKLHCCPGKTWNTFSSLCLCMGLSFPWIFSFPFLLEAATSRCNSNTGKEGSSEEEDKDSRQFNLTLEKVLVPEMGKPYPAWLSSPVSHWSANTYWTQYLPDSRCSASIFFY